VNRSISMTGRGALQAEDIRHVRRSRIHIRKVDALGRKACGCYRLIRGLSQQIGREPARTPASQPTRSAPETQPEPHRAEGGAGLLAPVNPST